MSEEVDVGDKVYVGSSDIWAVYSDERGFGMQFFDSEHDARGQLEWMDDKYRPAYLLHAKVSGKWDVVGKIDFAQDATYEEGE